MTCNAWKIIKIRSLILLIAFSLSACNLPATNPTTAPTPIATPIPLPTQTVTNTAPDQTLKSVPMVSLRTFQMVDAQHGWAASNQMALRTVDGGKSWQNVTPKDVPAGIEPVFQVTAVSDAAIALTLPTAGNGNKGAISSQAAWMIVPDAGDFKKGTLYRTTDGGQTWQNAAVPFGSGRVQFQDDKVHAVLMADRGVAAGSQGVDLYQTSDGGASWNLISQTDPTNPSDQGIPFGGNKSGVSFRDSAHGWLTGFIPMDGAAYLYGTQDGGKTWKQVELNLPAGWQQAQIVTKPPVFFGGQEGVLPLRASANVGQQVLLITRDGGDTWQATTPLEANGIPGRDAHRMSISARG